MDDNSLQAVNALETAVDLIYRFDVLFRAIDAVKEDKLLVSGLSGIGQALVWENGNDLDVIREELSAANN